jgi:hypothetical protein
VPLSAVLLLEQLSLQGLTTMAADHITLTIMVLMNTVMLPPIMVGVMLPPIMVGVMLPPIMVGVMLPPIMVGVPTTTSNRIRITATDIGQSTKVET